MKKLILIICFALLLCFFAVDSRAADIYIDPTWGGTETGTFAEPLASWPSTISTTDDYRQKCGTTTTETTITVSSTGTSGNHVVIGAYNADGSHEDGGNETFGQLCSGGGAKPIIDGTVDVTTGFEITGTYIEVNSVQLQQMGSSISVNGSNNIVRYSYFYDVTYGIRCNTSATANNALFEYNHFDLNAVAPDGGGLSTDAIELNENCDSGTIQYNEFTDYDHGAVDFQGGDSNTVQYNYMYSGGDNQEDFCIGSNFHSDNNTVRYNYCDGVGQGLEIFGGNDFFVYGNVFICDAGNGPYDNMGCVMVQSGSGSSAYTSSRNLIYNNVIYDHDNYSNDDNGIRVSATPGSDMVVEDNIFANNVIMKVGGACIHVRDMAAMIDNTTFYNNSCYDYGASKYAIVTDGTSNTYTTAANFNSEGRAEITASGNIDTDPGLNNAAVHEFWPASTASNIYQTGYNVGAPYDTLLDPDTTDFTASPPVVSTIQQATDFIGAYDIERDVAAPFSGMLPQGCIFN